MPMQLNAGLFRSNGGCGYVLKPPETRYGDDAAAPWDQETGAVTVLRMTLLTLAPNTNPNPNPNPGQAPAYAPPNARPKPQPCP